MMAHPFHVHGVIFRVLSIGGRPPAAHLAGGKDTILLDGPAELLMQFTQPATSRTPFMFHCHILEHEDAGMMGQYATI
jgi:FtsP/CotA-like multicopper oxidase with cupredoxin domain